MMINFAKPTNGHASEQSTFYVYFLDEWNLKQVQDDRPYFFRFPLPKFLIFSSPTILAPHSRPTRIYPLLQDKLVDPDSDTNSDKSSCGDKLCDP
jgi:hypothetical protein